MKKEIIINENKRRLLFIVKLAFLILLSYINVNYPSWINLENTPFSGVVKGVLFYLTANLLISSARILTVYFYIRRNRLSNSENNVVLAINRIATVLNTAALIGSFFLLVDLDWKTFFASFSLVAVASVLITKDYISNTINGLIIMVSDRVSLNDYVKIGNHFGKVVDITLSNVHLLDNSQYEILIPNNTVFGSDIINYTKKDSVYVEVNFELKPEHLTAVDQMEEHLLRHTQNLQDSIKKGSAELLFIQILSDKVQMQFRFKLKKSAYGQEIRLRHLVLKNVAEWTREHNTV